ncbi:MAG: BBE domain-containing protein, partial [Vitreimonas sp.]
HPDLFWGVRGGGGNFGVVTSFEYRLHRVAPLMLGGHLIYPISQARDVLNFFADYIANAPDELWMEPVLTTGPDGAAVLIFDVCHSGNLGAGESALNPLRQFRKPMQDLVRPTPYVELQRSNDVRTAPGRCFYVKQGFLRRIEPALVDALVGHFEEAPRTAGVMMFHAGGAIGRVASNATAFAHRHAQHGLLVQSAWDDRARSDEYVAAARATWRVVEPFTKGFYVNDLTAEHTQQRVNENYGANLARLISLKRRYDPGNLFRMNANVLPSG